MGTFTARDPEGGSTINVVRYWTQPAMTIDGVNPSTLSVDNQDFTIDDEGMLKFATARPTSRIQADANTDNTYLKWWYRQPTVRLTPF